MQDFYGFFSNGEAFPKAFSFVIITALSLVISKKIFFRWGFVDKPNFRSNHKKPVSLGGGIIIIPLIIFFSYFNNYVTQTFFSLYRDSDICIFIFISSDRKNFDLS